MNDEIKSKWLIIAYLVFLAVPMDIFTSLFGGGGDGLSTPILSLLACIFLLSFKFDLILKHIRYYIFVLIFFSYIFINNIFSINISASFNRSISFLFFIFLCSTLSFLIIDKEKFLKIFMNFTVYILIACYIAVLIIPSGVHTGDGGLFGEWRGVFDHKNGAAPMMSFFALFAICLWQFGKRALGAIIFIAALIFMVKTNGKGTMIATSITLLFLIPIYYFRSTLARFISICSAVLIMGTLSFGSLFIQSLEDFYKDNNIDYTFTGRREIWEFILGEIEKGSFGGTGFFAFWKQTDMKDNLESTFSSMSWTNNSHQAYLEIMIQLGIVGLILFLIFVFVVPMIDIFKAINNGNDPRIVLFLASFWLFSLLTGFMDSTMMITNASSWHMFLIVIFFLRYLAHNKWEEKSFPNKKPQRLSSLGL